MRKAPRRPVRQWWERKWSGERQWFRQACFSGVSCQTPAAISSSAPRTTLVPTIMEDSSSLRSRPHWAAVASRLKKPQAAR